ncbi:MAG: tRNA (guanosine(37)-N1)-methyltransferase TrmD [Deltaproteobacteria bacterium]|nr:MAG: tRNA (guanosine(37)-N1)-methyltransferase TrmD [Deltaproteobacteria bacterium]
MEFHILTLFPDFFTSPLQVSILKRAIAAGKISVRLHDIRDYATDRHRSVDDTPYGGGSGMVMKAEPVVAAIEAVEAPLPQRRVLLSPRGVPLTQERVQAFSRLSAMILVCGHYEGIDERALGHIDEAVSLGDYIVTGGEYGALVIVDAVTRLLPGVLGNAASFRDESFTDGLLEYPHYTRPRVWRGQEVPEVLLSGHHAEIERWRRQAALRITHRHRPDLLEKATLSPEDLRYLETLDHQRDEARTPCRDVKETPEE